METNEIPASAPVITPEPEKPKGKSSKSKRAAPADGTLTLAELSDRYLAHMEREGKSGGTIASYGMELKTAMAELGAETRVADLTPEHVQAFFDSKRVTRLKSGKSKAKPSIDKTRRVLRLALVWAEAKKLIEKAPIPALQAKA